MNVPDLIVAEALQDFLRREHAFSPAGREHHVGRVEGTKGHEGSGDATRNLTNVGRALPGAAATQIGPDSRAGAADRLMRPRTS